MKYSYEFSVFLYFRVDECAKNIVDVIQKSENGDAWILNKGDHEKVNFPEYCVKDYC